MLLIECRAISVLKDKSIMAINVESIVEHKLDARFVGKVLEIHDDVYLVLWWHIAEPQSCMIDELIEVSE